MKSLPFDTANNWTDFPEICWAIPWRTSTANNPVIQFEAIMGSSRWSIRLNDFPDEPLHTLLIDDKEVLHFDDWPHFWGGRPSFPR